MNGAKILLDTNIIIYYQKGHETTKALIRDNDITNSYITKIEVQAIENFLIKIWSRFGRCSHHLRS